MPTKSHYFQAGARLRRSGGGTVRIAQRWCRKNGLGPRATRWTVEGYYAERAAEKQGGVRIGRRLAG